MGKYNFHKSRTLIYSKRKILPKKPSLLRRSGYVIGKAFKRMFMVLGGLIFLSALISTISTSFMMKNMDMSVSDKSVLLLKIEGNIPEVRRSGYFPDPFAGREATLDQIITAIDKATLDENIKGIVLSLKGASITIAQAQELRDAVKKFKDSGKFSVSYAVSYGDGGSALANYYLASAFDTIWMQPIGIVSIAGFNAEMPFLKDFFEKIGVRGHFIQRKEYKSAMESFTRSGMSEYNKESMEAVIDDLFSQIVADISADRNIAPEQFSEYINQGIFVDKEALSQGLVDRVGYSDMVVGEIREIVDSNPESKNVDFIPVEEYYKYIISKSTKEFEQKEEIAVVHINGAIVQSDKRKSYMGAPLGIGGSVVAADNIADILYDIADDKDIKAVLLRINSPGGSPAASETIRRAILRVKEKGKKVVVSMGGAAASGGYWISADADYIFAQNSTLTGSIGVIGGKFDLAGLWDKLSINWESINKGENSTIWSINQGFSEGELKVMSRMMDNVYENFVNLVSSGRNMSIEEVEKIAKGRVWTGNDGLENGLVDEIGGYLDALDKVAEIIGKTDRGDLSIVILPRPKNPVEEILDIIGMQVMATGFFSSIFSAVNNSSVIETMNVLDDSNGVMIYSNFER